jgi:hypothetical protein
MNTKPELTISFGLVPPVSWPLTFKLMQLHQSVPQKHPCASSGKPYCSGYGPSVQDAGKDLTPVCKYFLPTNLEPLNLCEELKIPVAIVQARGSPPCFPVPTEEISSTESVGIASLQFFLSGFDPQLQVSPWSWIYKQRQHCKPETEVKGGITRVAKAPVNIIAQAVLAITVNCPVNKSLTRCSFGLEWRFRIVYRLRRSISRRSAAMISPKIWKSSSWL